MSSRESFRVMEEFAEQVSNEAIKKRHNYALERNKPFKNFRYEVDYDDDIRQEWFKFKALNNQAYLKRYLEEL